MSRMVKSLRSPTSSACRRSMRAARAWNVPSHTCSAIGPTMPETRIFISRAALLVKVTARMFQGLASPVATSSARREVSTRVLPVPAPESTSNGPDRVCTASRCGSFRPSSQGWAVEGAVCMGDKVANRRAGVNAGSRPCGI